MFGMEVYYLHSEYCVVYTILSILLKQQALLLDKCFSKLVSIIIPIRLNNKCCRFFILMIVSWPGTPYKMLTGPKIILSH